MLTVSWAEEVGNTKQAQIISCVEFIMPSDKKKQKKEKTAIFEFDDDDKQEKVPPTEGLKFWSWIFGNNRTCSSYYPLSCTSDVEEQEVNNYVKDTWVGDIGVLLILLSNLETVIFVYQSGYGHVFTW